MNRANHYTYKVKYIVFFLLTAASFSSKAMDGRPVNKNSFDFKTTLLLLSDSVPAAVKEIPKSRRQPVPVPVKIEVKPIQIIKPKIIKPIIKAIH